MYLGMNSQNMLLNKVKQLIKLQIFGNRKLRAGVLLKSTIFFLCFGNGRDLSLSRFLTKSYEGRQTLKSSPHFFLHFRHFRLLLYSVGGARVTKVRSCEVILHAVVGILFPSQSSPCSSWRRCNPKHPRNRPTALAVDHVRRRLLIADSGNHRILSVPLQRRLAWLSSRQANRSSP